MAAARQAVLVVDDDTEARSLLRGTLERAGYGVREAAHAGDALAAVDHAPPQLVLLEVVLPQTSGYEVYELLRGRLGERLPIIFLSGERTDRYDRIAGLLLGAEDYIVKPFDPDELLARVRRCLRPRRTAVDAPARDGENGTLEGLTRRELEILSLLARGETTAGIASQLVISRRTVGTHVQHILAKLGVSSRGQAVALAYRAGLVTADVEAHGQAGVGAR